jgi:hypothetical protein
MKRKHVGLITLIMKSKPVLSRIERDNEKILMYFQKAKVVESW